MSSSREAAYQVDKLATTPRGDDTVFPLSLTSSPSGAEPLTPKTTKARLLSTNSAISISDSTTTLSIELIRSILAAFLCFETVNDLVVGVTFLVLGVLIIIWLLLPSELLEAIIWWGFGVGCTACGVLPLLGVARRVIKAVSHTTRRHQKLQRQRQQHQQRSQSQSFSEHQDQVFERTSESSTSS